MVYDYFESGEYQLKRNHLNSIFESLAFNHFGQVTKNRSTNSLPTSNAGSIGAAGHAVVGHTAAVVVDTSSITTNFFTSVVVCHNEDYIGLFGHIMNSLFVPRQQI